VRPKDTDRDSNWARDQVAILFRKGAEFALDLSKKSKPYQLLLARVDRQATLKATWETVQGRIAPGTAGEVSKEAVLLVPKMHWRVDHHFRELEQKAVRSPSLGGSLGAV